MMTIRLETRDGHFVSEAMMPAFQLLPEAVFWGQRFFILHDKDGLVADGSKPVYREGFCCFLIPGEGLKT